MVAAKIGAAEVTTKKVAQSAVKKTGKASARQRPVARNRNARRTEAADVLFQTRTPRYQRLRQQFTSRGIRKTADQISAATGTRENMRRIRAAGIASAQSIAHLPFYGVQVCFAILYTVSTYLLKTNVGTAANSFIPIEFLSYVAWMTIFAIGTISMFQAWFVFTAARVNIWGNLSFVTFGLLTVCYMIPYLGFLPLMIIWVWLVVLFQ